ncbi:MAG TPA: hypothetical protein VFZ83_07235 [Acidimicrobiia bacterium]|nr:hypothetical protein [Acidimicrobiia bacterium]
MRRAAHLVTRFFGSLVARPLSAAERAWVGSLLTDAEHGVWRELRRADRRESVAVARRTERALAGGPHAADPDALAAALLHDVGKLDARLGPFRRAGATLAGALAGPEYARAWATRSGITRRVGLYLLHAEIGADRLRVVGARPAAVAWAAAHHDPARFGACGLPRAVVAALVRADGEAPLPPDW